MIVHCADISHPAKDWNLHQQWTEMLIEEFFKQVSTILSFLLFKRVIANMSSPRNRVTSELSSLLMSLCHNKFCSSSDFSVVQWNPVTILCVIICSRIQLSVPRSILLCRKNTVFRKYIFLQMMKFIIDFCCIG